MTVRLYICHYNSSSYQRHIFQIRANRRNKYWCICMRPKTTLQFSPVVRCITVFKHVNEAVYIYKPIPCLCSITLRILWSPTKSLNRTTWPRCNWNSSSRITLSNAPVPIMWHRHKRIPEGVYIHISADCVYVYIRQRTFKRFLSFMDENSSWFSLSLSLSSSCSLIFHQQYLKHVLEASQDLWNSSLIDISSVRGFDMWCIR